MKDYKYYLDKIGEIGYVDKVVHSLVYVEGLPKVRIMEVVVFEGGGLGMVLSLTRQYAEVLRLTSMKAKVGSAVARTGGLLQVPLSEQLLGKVINPLGMALSGEALNIKPDDSREVDIEPMGITGRTEIKKPFQTGVKIVDLIVPLGKGQRELVIGDRKTGKTQFLMQTMLSQAAQGNICIYAAIGKRQDELFTVMDFLEKHDITKNTILVVTGSAEPAGLIYLTPYTAMTIAEYFRDKGKDSLIIMDDLTAHAKYYREVTLLARRFPGRSSYPGDIFHIHARLMERAGSFEKATITCLPVADAVVGDLSGYIQTNLMSMTDGHIFFDSDRYNRGIRPAVNPFLSVTRVGLQAQSPLMRDLNRQVSSFLVHLEDLKDFMHFGAEVSEDLKRTLGLGERIETFFNQAELSIVPVNIASFTVAAIWGGFGQGLHKEQVAQEYGKLFQRYAQDQAFREAVDNTILASPSFSDLVANVKKQENILKS